MALKKNVEGSQIRIYKDGVYLGTVTGVSENSTLNVLEKNYLGDESATFIATTKEFDGTITRDMVDEHLLETIIGRKVTSKFSATDYTDPIDTNISTVSNGVPVDISFTTPNKTGLIIEAVGFNAQKIGSFAGGLDIEVWEGAAGVGTLKATLHCEAGEIPSSENEFVMARLDETAEVALTINVAHTLRFVATGTPTGSIDLWGVAAVPTIPYYAIEYEMSELLDADYTIDIVIPKADGTEMIIRDTGITFTSNAITMGAGELLTEALGWKAKTRTII